MQNVSTASIKALIVYGNNNMHKIELVIYPDVDLLYVRVFSL